MTNINLIGAEDISNAGRTMSQAAAEMSRAASSMDYALERHRLFMDDWLQRLESALAPKGDQAV